MRLLTLVLLAGLFGTAYAASPIGQVAEISGPVTAGPDRLASGHKLETGARLVAAMASEVTLRMADDSLVLLQGGSDLLIEKFVFNPAPGNAAASSHYVLHQGSVRLVPGALAKLTPGSVVVSTPYGNVLATGSDFTVGICSAGCADESGLYIYVKSGEVAFADATIGAGQMAFFADGASVAELDVRTPVFMVALVDNSLAASVDFREPDVIRLRQDAQDFLEGVIDPPASPSQPVASIAR